MTDQGRALASAEPNVFLAFDRLDDDQIVAEMKGAALQEYVYEFSQGGQMVRGLSKVGTDDASRIMAVKYGEALREIDCWLERDDEEAGYFKAKVARYIVKPDGTEIQMDAAVGHKRQPKYTITRKGDKATNPFWYEQGGQKALRNAKQKLMPETIKQAIIAMYVQQGRVKRVRVDGEPDASGTQSSSTAASSPSSTAATPTSPSNGNTKGLPNYTMPDDPAEIIVWFDAAVEATADPGLSPAGLKTAGQDLARDFKRHGLTDELRHKATGFLTGKDSFTKLTGQEITVLRRNCSLQGAAKLAALAKWIDQQASDAPEQPAAAQQTAPEFAG